MFCSGFQLTHYLGGYRCTMYSLKQKALKNLHHEEEIETEDCFRYRYISILLKAMLMYRQNRIGNERENIAMYHLYKCIKFM